jgi:glycosyltransferase involved in cell wall biosynthesis
LPVVASPVGLNARLVIHGENGLLAQDNAAWTLALEKLCKEPGLRRAMGNNGRKLVERCYSLQATAVRLSTLLREAGTA